MQAKTTLEQWEILQAVIDLGGYTQAANVLHRSQSSVSYQLSLLQERLGIELLTIHGRKAELTPEGENLLAQARSVIRSFHALEARAHSLKMGEQASINLVVDSTFPKDRLFHLLSTFQKQHPATRIHLTEVLRNETSAQLKARDADIYIITQREIDGCAGRWLMNVDFVAVAHSHHPLFSLPTPLSHEALSRYPCVEIVMRTPPHSQPASAESWTFTTFEAATQAVLHQVGYGWLPEARISEHITRGELHILPLQQGERRTTPLYLLAEEKGQPLGKEIIMLIELLFGRL
ncbi:LysR-family transcriptional regulator [Pectobacterium atrosepticum SCRI1043]|uniref:LysR-family transcriptional regulator n=1 Tax=Pectobacterium atrosepticum (strain SCRI 1043 / ATCC BAA-672) TaxID=218491 RepID=Q6DB33_PECAS|nr:LysR family transcriptional regulator [Pectobacterium atrosepticum]GKV87372.1 LysR family transcriptional regulator [Pectobacterium carotovorum subsp. carotovorum]AIA69085.1 LysR family transcriptional regulator [Pectobacterium atrosepticum]AIK11990.1 LysR-family transcriptional regulator [Pectobacterium atrosepticum]KFX13538.1 LysR family transcriptional regulator [Pectobacterium atrosepticum]MCL6318536.1 LysR family transcriptional regulator [Pectobacterium atrosepticum]